MSNAQSDTGFTVIRSQVSSCDNVDDSSVDNDKTDAISNNEQHDSLSSEHLHHSPSVPPRKDKSTQSSSTPSKEAREFVEYVASVETLGDNFVFHDSHPSENQSSQNNCKFVSISSFQLLG